MFEIILALLQDNKAISAVITLIIGFLIWSVKNDKIIHNALNIKLDTIFANLSSDHKELKSTIDTNHKELTDKINNSNEQLTEKIHENKILITRNTTLIDKFINGK